MAYFHPPSRYCVILLLIPQQGAFSRFDLLVHLHFFLSNIHCFWNHFRYSPQYLFGNTCHFDSPLWLKISDFAYAAYLDQYGFPTHCAELVTLSINTCWQHDKCTDTSSEFTSDGLDLTKGENVILFLNNEKMYGDYMVVFDQGKFDMDPKGVVYRTR